MILSACWTQACRKRSCGRVYNVSSWILTRLTFSRCLKTDLKQSRCRSKSTRTACKTIGRDWSIIRASAVDPEVQGKALKIFERLASVEAGIHGKALSEVHLHELSGDDTIVDVVGSLIGIQQLGIEQIEVSPIPLGRDW